MRPIPEQLPRTIKHKLVAAELMAAGLRPYVGDTFDPVGILCFSPSVRFGGAPIITFRRLREEWTADVRKELSTELLRRNPQLRNIHVRVAADDRFRVYVIDEQEGLNELVRALLAIEELKQTSVQKELHLYDTKQRAPLLIDALVGVAQFEELSNFDAGESWRQALSESTLFFGSGHVRTRALQLSLLAHYASASAYLIMRLERDHDQLSSQDAQILVHLESTLSRQIALANAIGVDATVDLERLGQWRTAAAFYWHARRRAALAKSDAAVELAFSTACLVEVLRRMESAELTSELTQLHTFVSALTRNQKAVFDMLIARML